MKKLIIVGLIFIFSPLRANAEIVFSDLNNQTEYQEAFNFLINQKVVNGYPDGTIRPYDCVKRVEFLKILSLASEADIDFSNKKSTKNFPDTNQESWYWPYLSYSLQEGIVSGYPDGLFMPARCMQRSEAIKMAAETFGYNQVEKNTFAIPRDVNGSSWYGDYFKYAWENGYLGLNHALETGNGIIYDIGGEMYRAEAIELVYRFMNKSKVEYFTRITQVGTKANSNQSVIVYNELLTCEEKVKLSNDLTEINNSLYILEIDDCSHSLKTNEEIVENIEENIGESKKITLEQDVIYIAGDFYMQVEYPEAEKAGMNKVLEEIGYECLNNGQNYCNEWSFSGKISSNELKKLEPFIEFIILEY